MSEIVSVQHTGMQEGRASLRAMDFSGLGIPSISPDLDTRWRAEFKGKFLDPGDNEKFLNEVLTIVTSLNDITTQRAVYYQLRAAHPEWEYKNGPLGDEFYQHLIGWIMEKAQLKTGLTMQSMGIWAGPRGWIAGDGFITSPRRGRAPLHARPQLDFDIADEGASLATNAHKVIHFEKDAGLSTLISDNFPKYVEAIFSTSQGQLTEAATKFMRLAEDKGMKLYSVHDADPAGIQMSLMHGMSSKNSCYMPDEFYPTLVRPLGFYPSIGDALGLPPEDVTEKEDKIFNNLVALVNEKQKMFPQLRRYKMGSDVNVIIQQRRKWEFQALNAIHETAPKIYILEGLRVHNDEIKRVHKADAIKRVALAAAQTQAEAEVETRLAALADNLYAKKIRGPLINTLRENLQGEIDDYRSQVEQALAELRVVPDENFRESVKQEIVRDPTLYAVDVIKKLGKRILSATFRPEADVDFEINASHISSASSVNPNPPADTTPLTKTDLVESIERHVIKQGTTRSRVVGKIRSALEDRFGAANEQW